MDKKNVQSKRITPNKQNLSLKGYFTQLPKAKRKTVILSAPKEDLITILAEATNRDRHTVRCWLLGYTQPSIKIKKVIADILQSDIATLFPEQ